MTIMQSYVQTFIMKFCGVTILQGVEFSIFLLIFAWTLEECSANMFLLFCCFTQASTVNMYTMRPVYNALCEYIAIAYQCLGATLFVGQY